MEAIAQDTEGFSGADLQALIYNAHLEVVHEAIAATRSDSGESKSSRKRGAEDEIGPIRYTVIGKSVGEERKVMTRAEEESMQRKLRRIIANTTRSTKKTDSASLASESKPSVQVYLIPLIYVHGLIRIPLARNP